MHRTLAIGVAVAALMGATVGTASGQPTRACAEGDACWAWSTMGNHTRGVVTLYGNSLVVGPCRFRRLFETGHIAYTQRVDGHTYVTLDRMRGDTWARAHGCVRTRVHTDT